MKNLITPYTLAGQVMFSNGGAPQPFTLQFPDSTPVRIDERITSNTLQVGGAFAMRATWLNPSSFGKWDISGDPSQDLFVEDNEWGQPYANQAIMTAPLQVPPLAQLKIETQYNAVAGDATLQAGIMGWRVRTNTPAYQYPTHFRRVPTDLWIEVPIAHANPSQQTIEFVTPNDADYEITERLTDGEATIMLQTVFKSPDWGSWDSIPIFAQIWGQPGRNFAYQRQPFVVPSRSQINVVVNYLGGAGSDFSIWVGFRGNRIYPQ